LGFDPCSLTPCAFSLVLLSLRLIRPRSLCIGLTDEAQARVCTTVLHDARRSVLPCSRKAECGGRRGGHDSSVTLYIVHESENPFCLLPVATGVHSQYETRAHMPQQDSLHTLHLTQFLHRTHPPYSQSAWMMNVNAYLHHRADLWLGDIGAHRRNLSPHDYDQSSGIYDLSSLY
jgi:hypothetical protein